MILTIVSAIVAIPVLCLLARYWWVLLALGIFVMASPLGALLL